MPLRRIQERWVRHVVNLPRIMGIPLVTTILALTAPGSIDSHALPRVEEGPPHHETLGEVLRVSHLDEWLRQVSLRELPGAVLQVSHLRVGRDLLHHGDHIRLIIARVDHDLPRHGDHPHLVIARVGQDHPHLGIARVDHGPLHHGDHILLVLGLLSALLEVVPLVLETYLRLSLVRRVRLCLLTILVALRLVPESPSMISLNAIMSSSSPN